LTHKKKKEARVQPESSIQQQLRQHSAVALVKQRKTSFSKKKMSAEAPAAKPEAVAAAATERAAGTGRGKKAEAAAPKPGAVSCNWQALKQQLAAEAASAKPRKWHKTQHAGGTDKAAAAAVNSKGGRRGLTHVVALDCEMVGVGSGGTQDALARVCIVSRVDL
jgi:RNA exonuclease 4